MVWAKLQIQRMQSQLLSGGYKHEKIDIKVVFLSNWLSLNSLYYAYFCACCTHLQQVVVGESFLRMITKHSLILLSYYLPHKSHTHYLSIYTEMLCVTWFSLTCTNNLVSLMTCTVSTIRAKRTLRPQAGVG